MRTLIFSMLLLCTSIISAQFVREANISLSMGEDGSMYGVVPAGHEGVALYHKTKNPGNYNKQRWEISVLNTDLTFSWGSAFESDLNFVISDAKYSGGYLFFLFKDVNIPMKSVLIMKINLNTQKIFFFQISEFLPKEVVGFEVLGKSLFIIGRNNQKPAVLKFTYGDPRPKVLQGLFEEKNEILHISVDAKQEYIQIISSITKKGIGSVILIKRFDEEGQIKQDYLLKSTKGHRLLNAVAASDDEGNTAISGVFSYGNSKFSNGVFTAVFKNGNPGQLYYYDYGNLHHFFDYLEAPDKIEKEQQKNHGRSIKMNHIPRQIMKQNDEWRYLGEVTETTTKNHGAWNTEYTAYLFAIALRIDNDGKIKWDNTFSLNQKTTVNSRQQTYINSYGEKVILFYTDGIGVHFKVMDDQNEFAPHNLFLFDPRHADSSQGTLEQFGDEIPEKIWKMEPLDNLIYWYDQSYLSFGLVNLSAQSPKRALFINKISLEANPTQ